MMKKILYILLLLTTLVPMTFAGMTISNYALELEGYELAGIYWRTDPAEHYVEDYYIYYWRRLNDSKDNLLTGILYMQYALNAPFRHPVNALCPIRSEEQHWKYKYLMRMRIYLLIVKNYLRLGSRYDFENQAYYYHKDFADQLIDHLEIGRYYYEHAKVYWPYVVQNAEYAAAYEGVHVEWDKLEDEMYQILVKDVDWDYEDIIAERIERINERITWLEQYRDSE